MSNYRYYNQNDNDNLANNKKYKQNKKNVKTQFNYEDYEDDEEEEEEENEESEKSKSSIKKSKNTLYKEKNILKNSEIITSLEETIPKKTEQEYLAQIEQLQNELNLEKKISESIKDSLDYKNKVTELQNILKEKNKILSQLTSSNKKQDTALKLLRKQLDIEENKIELNKINKKNNYSNNNSQKLKFKIVSPNKITKTSKSEAINIVLKVKDKEINDYLKKMNLIKKENELLIKELYKNNNYHENISIKDSSREYSQKIKELQNESKFLNIQLETHQKCLKEFEKYNKEIEELKKTLKQLKENKYQINLNLKNKELELNQKNYIEESAIVKKTLSPRDDILKSNIYKKLNVPIYDTKNYAKITLPSIPTTQLIKTPKKSILSKEFCMKLKNYFGKKETEYNDLTKKINQIEQKGLSIQNKHKNELKIFNSQIGNLDEQFKSLNTERRGNSSNIKTMRFKLHIVKNETKHVMKEFQNLKLKLENLKKNINQRDFTIYELQEKVNAIRNKAKIKLEKQESKMEKYVDNIKNDNKNIENKKKMQEKIEKILESMKEEKSRNFDCKIPLINNKINNISNKKSNSVEKEVKMKNNLNDINLPSQCSNKDLSKNKKNKEVNN